MKFFHHSQKKIFTNVIVIAVMFVFLLYTFYLLPKKSLAEEVFLYPEVCTGTWSKSETVAGQDFSDSSRGAHSSAVGDELSCLNFKGDVPPGIEVLSASLEFIWGEKTPESVTPPSIEESYDLKPIDVKSSVPVTEIEKLDEKSSDEVKIETDLKLDTENQKSDIEKSSPNQEKLQDFEPQKTVPEPVSWLSTFKSLGVAEVKAEEIQSVTDVEVVAPKNIEIQKKVEEKTNTTTELTEKLKTPVDEKTTLDVDENNLDKTETLDSPLISQEISPEINAQTSEPSSVSDNTSGTALFDISYQLDDSPSQTLGSLYQESLSEKISIPLQYADIARLVVTIKSRLTLDSTEYLVLQGVRLGITYSLSETSDDPFPQPDLTRDTVLDDVISENIEVIRLKRNKTKANEIWYRYVTPGDVIQLKDTETEKPEVINNDSSEALLEENLEADVDLTMPTTTYTPSLDSEALITNTTQIALDETKVENESISSTKKNILKTKKDKDTKYEWNFVAGDDAVHESFPIDYRSNFIFWLNKEGTVINAFNIFTQGFISQSFESEDTSISLTYWDTTDKEKKVFIDLDNQKFIFSD